MIIIDIVIKQVGVLFSNVYLIDLKCLSVSENRDSKFMCITFIFFSYLDYLILFVKNVVLCLHTVNLTYLNDILLFSILFFQNIYLVMLIFLSY